MEKSKKRAFIIVDKANIMREGLVIYDKMVLVVLCAYADNKTKKCYPSIKTIANEAGCSARQVLYSLKKLESEKIIKIERRKSKNGDQTSNLYTILVPCAPPAQPAPPHAQPAPPPAQYAPPHAQPAPKLYSTINTSLNNAQSSSSVAAGVKDWWRKKVDLNFFRDNMPEKVDTLNSIIDILADLNEKKYENALDEFDALSANDLIEYLKTRDFTGVKHYNAYLTTTVKNYLLQSSLESLY